jgi:hypothetical protein
MVTFLTLYRGPSLAAAELIAVSTDPELVGYVATALLRHAPGGADDDPALTALSRARRRALRIVRLETADRTGHPRSNRTRPARPLDEA